jgi:rubrerythrin
VATLLHRWIRMRLDHLLVRSLALEERAAQVYDRFAASSRADGALARLWSDMAATERAHAAAVRDARARVRPTDGWRTQLEGWNEALHAIEERLERAERVGSDASDDRRLAAALDLEGSELDGLRDAALHAAGASSVADEDHVARLSVVARELSTDPHVQLAAARLLAHERLCHRR